MSIVAGYVSVIFGPIGALISMYRRRFLLVILEIVYSFLTLVQFGLLTVGFTTTNNKQQISSSANMLWNQWDDSKRNYYQSLNNCCGFSTPNDRFGKALVS